MLRSSMAGRLAMSALTLSIATQTPAVEADAAKAETNSPPPPLEVVFPQSISEKDSQYLYDYELLRQALAHTQETFGPVEIRPSKAPMNQSRAEDEIMKENGLITVFARSTSIQKERDMLPVRIPIDKGLISYRVFLIRDQDKSLFSSVESLADLKQLSVGSFSTWADTEILRSSGFNVVTGDSYEGLFRMLVAGRFDFFSRGVDEAYREYDERKTELPTMAVEQTLLLHFPTTRYFFVQRSPSGHALATRIHTGLMQMIADGSFDQLFYQFKGHLIAQAKLDHRKLIKIPNPYLSPDTPLDQKELWFDPGLEAETTVSKVTAYPRSAYTSSDQQGQGLLGGQDQ